jgi:hypothetical protein
VVVVVDVARIVKWAADLKLTGAGPAASNVRDAAINATAKIRPISIGFVWFILSARKPCAAKVMWFMVLL